jgi:para-nitrobenzyl esterase
VAASNGLRVFVQGLAPEVIQRVTGALHNAWIGFIREGQPEHDSLPSWPQYTADRRAVLIIGDDSMKTETNMPRPQLCA